MPLLFSCQTFAVEACQSAFNAQGFHDVSLIDSYVHQLQQLQELQRRGHLQEAAWLYAEVGQFQVTDFLEKQIQLRLLKGVLEKPPEILSQGSGESYLVTFKDGIRAIFKPSISHWRHRRVRPWHHARRAEHEVAAYIFDRAVGGYIVPVTVFRTLNGTPGSLQIFVTKGVGPKIRSKLRTRARLTILDYLMDIYDRRPPNHLEIVGGDAAIDNELGFLSNPLPLSLGIKPPPQHSIIEREPVAIETFRAVDPQTLLRRLDPYLIEPALQESLQRLDQLGLLLK